MALSRGRFAPRSGRPSRTELQLPWFLQPRVSLCSSRGTEPSRSGLECFPSAPCASSRPGPLGGSTGHTQTCHGGPSSDLRSPRCPGDRGHDEQFGRVLQDRLLLPAALFANCACSESQPPTASASPAMLSPHRAQTGHPGHPEGDVGQLVGHSPAGSKLGLSPSG